MPLAGHCAVLAPLFIIITNTLILITATNTIKI